jgi:RNA polymerase sigma-70 factor (ECF subfamily)
MPDRNIFIQRWQDGDEHAAEVLYNRHHDATFRLAYGLLGDRFDAEEVAQDALPYALTHIDHFDPELASFQTWLHMITISRCRDRQRGKRLLSFSLSKWLQRGGDRPDPSPSPERQATQTETYSEVWAAIQTLKPKQREAVLLRYWAGHTYQEMADILGCPLRTAQSRVRLAYTELRAILAPTAVNYFEPQGGSDRVTG